MSVKSWPRWADMPEFHDLPEGWSIDLLTDHVDVTAGQSPPSETYNDKEDGMPFLQGCTEFGDTIPITRYWCSAPSKIAPKDSTLMSVRAPVGELNRADQVYAIGRGLAAIITKGMNPDFLFYGLHRWRHSFQRLGQGSTFEAITARQIKQVIVAVPQNIDEQRRIAAALKLADDAIFKAKAELKAARELKLALMSALFSSGISSTRRTMKDTKLGRVPADWSVTEIRSFWTSSANGLYVPENQYGSGVPIVRIDTFNDGYFYTRDFKRIRIIPEEAQAFSLTAGDLLVNRVNSIPFLGKVVFVDRVDEFTVFESNMMRLRFETAEMAQYLAFYLSVPAVKKRIWAMGRPAVAQLSINQRDVGKFLVALPGKDERNEIIGAVIVAKEAEQCAGEKLAALEEMKKSLLQNLLTGKIRIPEEAIHG